MIMGCNRVHVYFSATVKRVIILSNKSRDTFHCVCSTSWCARIPLLSWRPACKPDRQQHVTGRSSTSTVHQEQRSGTEVRNRGQEQRSGRKVRNRGPEQRSGTEVRNRGQEQRSGTEVRNRGKEQRSGTEVRNRSQEKRLETEVRNRG